MNDPVNLQLSDIWKSSFPYVTVANEWLNALKGYLSLNGNAAIESIKSNTIESLKIETLDYQKRSWRKVL